MSHLSALASVVVIITALVGPVSAASLIGTARVIDGDTLAVGAARVRLAGIDTPEVGQHCERQNGKSWACDVAATALMVTLAEGKEVSCEVQDVDAYGRLVSLCRVGSLDLGREMVDQGLAWAFLRYSDEYAGEEASARAANRGIWRDGLSIGAEF